MMRHPSILFVSAAVSLIAWVVLTFTMHLRTGWTHVPLVLGILLIVVGIVGADERRFDV